MKDDNSQVASEYGISVGASKMFADGNLGYTNQFSGLCYVGIARNGVTKYRWGHTLTVNGKWDMGLPICFTLK
jgi:hypothetical protein